MDHTDGVDTLAVALLQMRGDDDSSDANLSKADTFCRRAAAQGADIAVFPEMFNIACCDAKDSTPESVAAWQARAEAGDGLWVTHFTGLARELDIAIACAYLEAKGGGVRNVVSLIDRHGTICFTYAKVHTCTFMAGEAACEPGCDFYVAELDTKKGPVHAGAMICFDRELPESARILMLKGAEVILIPNASRLETMHLHQLEGRALENAAAVCLANYPQSDDFNGRSAAFVPSPFCCKSVIAGSEEEVALSRIDLEALRQYRATTSAGNAYRRPSRYGALLDTSVAPIFRR